MTLEERDALLAASIPEFADQQSGRRYAVRRGTTLEWFVAVLTEYREGEPVFHGYPVNVVPGRVLRAFRDRGHITEAEYRRVVKELG